MSALLQQLKTHGDFLHLTQANPDSIDPFDFTLANNTQVSVWDTGVICFEPASLTHKDVVLSCGVHGNETAPIEICAELVQDLILGKLTLEHRLLVLWLVLT